MYAPVEYLAWANATFGTVRYNLAKAGVAAPSADVLGPPPRFIERSAWIALREAVATYNEVRGGEVLPALGTSHALWLALAALLRPGDEVLVESPAYEPLWRVPEGLGAVVRRFERRAEDSFALPVGDVVRQVGPRTKAVVLSSPHNPSGVRDAPDDLARLAGQCGDAVVVVDEIFGPVGHVVDRGVWGGSARRVAPNIVAISGLSKAYGLGEQRIGWVSGPSAFVQRCEAALVASLGEPPLGQATMALHAMGRLDSLSRIACRGMAEAEAVVAAWIDARPALSWTRPAGSLFGFVHARESGDLTERVLRGAKEHDVLVAPGSFFGDPARFRLGWSMGVERLPDALARLDRVLASARD